MVVDDTVKDLGNIVKNHSGPPRDVINGGPPSKFRRL